MSIIGMSGFGGLVLADDEITLITGALSYSTDTPNANTDRALSHGSAIAQSRAHIPWTVAKSHFWYHYHFKNFDNNTSNDQHVLGYGNGGVLLGGVSFEDSTNKLTIQINGVVVATSIVVATLATWVSIHVEVTLDAATGTVDVYKDGDLTTPVVSFGPGNTDPTAAGTADQFFFHMRQLSSRIANLIAMDPDDATGIVDANEFANPQIAVYVPDADSVTYAAWTPDSGAVGYTQIDERPSNPADYVEATAIGQASTFSHQPSLGVASVVTAVKWSGQMTRTGTDAGVNVIVRRRQGVSDVDEAAVAAPGSGMVSFLWDEKVGGGNWSPTDLDATEFGVVSET